MKKIMFSDEFGLTKLVIEGKKTQTRRISTKPAYKVGEVVAVAERYTNETFTDGCNEKGFSNKMFVRPDRMRHRIKFTKRYQQLLQDISEYDCICEGIFYNGSMYCYYLKDKKVSFLTARQAFASLIDSMSGKGTWNSNPKVWVYEFELVK